MESQRSTGALPVRIDGEREWAWCGDRRLVLAPRAFAVLRHLVERAGRLVTKDELLAIVWAGAAVSDAALSSCVRDLRRELRDSSSAPRYIETVHRRGFRFIGPVSLLPDAGAPEPPAPAPGALGATRAPEPVAAPPDPMRPAAHLVGRGAELARLHAELGRALDGQRRLVFVTGEPGIGKTALVEAFLDEIGGGQAVQVARGQCVEHFGAGEAYLPVLEALGRLGRGPTGARLVDVLTRHAPTWLAELPGLLTDEELEAVKRRAPDATRERMLRELIEALEALSLDAPLVLVLEDLHWSDSATIDVLGMLARRREPARLLVVATYRPADAAGAGHPVREVKRELQAHGQCEEVALEFLDVSAVEQYLRRRFPDHAFPPELAPLLHRRTEGNPLFLVATTDILVAQGQLSNAEGRWTASGPVDAIATAVPRTLSQMVDTQLERLTAGEQALLAVASVAGAEFSAAVAAGGGIDAHEADAGCAALARRGQFLRPAGEAEWPDGTVAGRYAFIHALYQQAIYERLPAGWRVALHRQTGERLERAYGARAAEIAGELAMHFEQGRDVERAVRYRRQAGEHALRQHAYREAADHAARAVALLQTVPGGADTAEELGLQLMLGAALAATRGYAAPEVERAYARARELSDTTGDHARLLPILLGLARYYIVRGDCATAREVAARLLATAESSGDRAMRLAAHNALGVASFYAGELAEALAHLEVSLELYDPALHSPARSALFRLGHDPAVSCSIHAGWALWMLGQHERAGARVRAALDLARELGHPLSLSYACHFAAGFHQWRREREMVQALEEEAHACDVEHGFELFLTAGEIQRGWLMAGAGKAEEGLARMRQGLARHRAIGAEVLVPSFLALVAEVHGEVGQPEAGLAAVNDALERAARWGPSYWEAELHRLRGTLALAAEPGSETAAREAEACFGRALETARRQGALPLELRAATCLARLRAGQGRVEEARALLAGVYGRFADGFETADLRDARSLLAELGRGPGGAA